MILLFCLMEGTSDCAFRGVEFEARPLTEKLDLTKLGEEAL